jgi:hypothetical protein
MQGPKDSGLDRVEAVLSMRVADAVDLLRFSASIADFSSEELIRLASELPRHGSEVAGSGSVIRTSVRRP